MGINVIYIDYINSKYSVWRGDLSHDDPYINMDNDEYRKDFDNILKAIDYASNIVQENRVEYGIDLLCGLENENISSNGVNKLVDGLEKIRKGMHLEDCLKKVDGRYCGCLCPIIIANQCLSSYKN